MASRNKLMALGIVLSLFVAVTSVAASAPAESAEESAPAAQPPSAAPGEENQEMEGPEEINAAPPMTPAASQAFCHCYCRCGSQRVEACIPAGTAANCSQFNGQECSDFIPTCHIEPTLSSCVPPDLSPFDCP